MSHATTATMMTATSTPIHLSTIGPPHLDRTAGDLVRRTNGAVEEGRVPAMEGRHDATGQRAAEIGRVAAATGEPVDIEGGCRVRVIEGQLGGRAARDRLAVAMQ